MHVNAKLSSQKFSLRGKLVVVTRSVEGSEPWITYLKKQGATPYFFPTIEIVPAKLTPKVKNILKKISDFDWVVFTSAAGVRSLKNLAEKSKLNISSARMPKIAVIGDATAKAARAAGYRVAFQPSAPSSAALAYEFEPVHGKSILLPRTPIAPPDMRNIFTARGAQITELAIYKTVLRSDRDPKFEKLLKNNKINFLTFASPSAVRGFFQRVPKALHKKILALPAVAIGSSVATALHKAGFKNIKVGVYYPHGHASLSPLFIL